MIKVKVLVACEESQEVCKAFRKLGYEAYSCDILPCSGGHPEWHIQCDVLEILGQQINIVTQDGKEHWIDKWTILIAHPPCTHLSVSGARWFTSGHKDLELREKAIDFVRKLMEANIEFIAIENPISVLSTRIRKPDQIIRPFEFGENSTKATCLWLKGLPKLKATKIITPTKHTTKSGLVYDEWWFKTCLISDLKKRALVRSKTFPGIAKAMAEQWTNPRYIQKQLNEVSGNSSHT